MTDKAFEVVSFQATAPDAGAPMVAVSGNSLTIRDAKKARLLALWGRRQSAGFVRLTSPLLHDAVVGIQLQQSADVVASKRYRFSQDLDPQDTIVATGSGSATAGDIESNSMLVIYEDLSGICADLITVAELEAAGIEEYASTNTLTMGTSGGYSGSEAINAEQDQLKANERYAIVGCSVSAPGGLNTVRYVAPDWGNLGIGLPANALDSGFSSDYFARLSRMTGEPTIPVFNASNKGLVLIDGLTDEDGGSPVVITHMVRMGLRRPEKPRGRR